MSFGALFDIARTFNQPFGLSTSLKERASIDDLIDRLHYRATSACLLAMCTFITAADIAGNMIECNSMNFNAYCSYNMFTIPNCNKRKTGGTPGANCIYLGVGPDYGQEKIYHSYCTWVPVLLFFHAAFFYLPHYLWKHLEGGKISIVSNYISPNVIDPEVLKEQKKKSTHLANYVLDTLHKNRFFYIYYIFCKVLNVANVVANIYFINWYLNGTFLTYGWKALDLFYSNNYDNSDFMQEVFPFVTKCDFKQYGPSGTTENKDVICVLPWNPIEQKFYIFIWFWLIILLGLSVLNLVYRLADFFLPVLRRFHLRRLQPPSVNNSTTSNSPTQTLVKRLSIGNFYFVYMLGHNMDSLIFSYFLNELSQLLSSNDKNSHERTNEHEMKPIIKIC